MEGLTLTDILSNVSGIGMLGMLCYILYTRHSKQEDKISKLENDKFTMLQEERNTYRDEHKRILEELVRGINVIADGLKK